MSACDNCWAWAFLSLSKGRIAGNRITSFILLLFDKNITRRSIPIPQPAVGGKPCSKASQKNLHRWVGLLHLRQLDLSLDL